MTYIPSKEDLEEMKFKEYKSWWWFRYKFSNWASIKYNEWIFYISLLWFSNWRFPIFTNMQIHPESKEDIATLIKMFTPNNN